MCPERLTVYRSDASFFGRLGVLRLEQSDSRPQDQDSMLARAGKSRAPDTIKPCNLRLQRAEVMRGDDLLVAAYDSRELQSKLNNA